MCQAKPLPRCSSHAPGIVDAADYKYVVKKAEADRQHAKLLELIESFKERGFSEEEISQATGAKFSRIRTAREKYRQKNDEANERLRDVWEAELHRDATKVGYKELLTNPLMPGRELRLENATALRAWHKRLRAIKGNDGVNLFGKSADSWMKESVLEEEYKEATQKYRELAFQFNTIGAEGRRLKEEFNVVSEKATKTAEDRANLENLRVKAAVMRSNQTKVHFAMVFERTKKSLIQDSLSVEFKESLQTVT